jgi:thioester reductase-like protein
VLGGAIAEALTDDHDVVGLSHREPVPGASETITGSVAEPRLGLGERDYAELAKRVDAVVHCAAISTYGSKEDELRKVNVKGTGHVAQLCADGDALLYHAGTALEPTEPKAVEGNGKPPERSQFSREPYLRSKQEAEKVVRSSGVPACILRPSIVIGDTATGVTPQFQGVHTLMRFMLDNSYGVVPADPAELADYLPRDLMAQVVKLLIDDRATPDVCWLTAGNRAPNMERIVDIVHQYGQELGLENDKPRFMDPEVVDRLVKPALLPELPRRARQRFEYVIEFSYALRPGRIFPSSLDDFESRIELPDTEALSQAMLQSLRYWGSKTLDTATTS